MAAPMSLRKVLCRLKVLRRCGTQCKRFAKVAAAEVIKDPIKTPIPWEDRPDGILIMNEHPPFLFKLEDALNMHKEAAQPALSDCVDASIYADMLLDFTSKKVTKPMKHYVDLIRFPHKFDYRQEKKYMVFSESDETLEVAKSLGVHVYGGLELIERLMMGRVHKDDIQMTDFVLATPDIFSKMPKLRPIFKLKFPSYASETVGEDIKTMMENLDAGLRYATDKNPVDETHARVQIPFGQLNQEVEALSNNFDHMVQHFFHKKNEKLSPHIKEVSLIAPPSEERFMLNMNYIQRKEPENVGKVDSIGDKTLEEGGGEKPEVLVNKQDTENSTDGPNETERIR